jgi:hypothetical protein
MTKKVISEAEAMAGLQSIADALGVPLDYVVKFHRYGDGGAWVEFKDSAAHYLIGEREKVWTTVYTDLDEFLYRVTFDAANNLGSTWELNNRTREPEEFDTRIAWLAKQLQLMNRVNPVWGARFRDTIAAGDHYDGVRVEDVDAYPLD